MVDPPRLGRAVGGEVLGAGEHRVARGEVVALEAAHARRGEDRTEIGVLARPLDDAAPAGVAGDVDHRSEGPVDALRGRLRGGDPRAPLGEPRIPAAGFGQRNGEHGSLAVDHIESEEQRNAKA